MQSDFRTDMIEVYGARHPNLRHWEARQGNAVRLPDSNDGGIYSSKLQVYGRPGVQPGIAGTTGCLGGNAVIVVEELGHEYKGLLTGASSVQGDDKGFLT